MELIRLKMGKKEMIVFLVLFFVVVGLVAFASVLVLVKYNVITINNLVLEGSKVMITPSAKSQLDTVYTDDVTTEIPVCLGGTVDEEGIRIDSIEETRIIESTPTNVTYVQCPVYIGHSRTVGTLHNHVGGSCFPSGNDMTTYSRDIRRGQSVIGIFCDDEYVFWMLTSLEAEVLS